MTALEPDRPSRHFSASMRVSAARSSWSRERFSRAITLGVTSRATPARYFSSTSMTPYLASEPPASAEVMPAGDVRAQRVGDDRTAGPQGLRDQPGRRGLAVRRGDEDDVEMLRERSEEIGVEFECDLATDHRSASASRGPRHRRRGLARRHGQLGPRRKRLCVACHRPLSSLRRSAPAYPVPAGALTAAPPATADLLIYSPVVGLRPCDSAPSPAPPASSAP